MADTPLTLRRTDPITPERLMAMGAVKRHSYYLFTGDKGKLIGIFDPNFVVVTPAINDSLDQNVRDLGHLHDLLTALGVQVPPLADTNKGGE